MIIGKRRRLPKGELDDISEAVMMLLVWWNVKTGRVKLTANDRVAVVLEYERVQRRLFRIIRERRTWQAITILAEKLLVRGHLTASEANEIIWTALPTKGRLV